MLFLNCAALSYMLQLGTAVKIAAIAILSAAYLFYCVRPRAGKAPSKKLKRLVRGYELVLMSSICTISEYLLYIYFILFVPKAAFSTLNIVVNGVICAVFVVVMLLIGLVRVFASSGQLGATLRVCLVCLWWLPIANIVLFYKCCRAARMEYEFEAFRIERNAERKGEAVCATRYPILMVHGIFFRDWKLFGYWGRITNELAENGAALYFGNQQSSSSGT